MMDYELIRSDRRSLSLSVRDGRPLVRAPRRLAKREIDRFVAAHEDWIKAQLERARPIQTEKSPEEEKRLRKAAREYLPGRVAYYGGLMGLYPGHNDNRRKDALRQLQQQAEDIVLVPAHAVPGGSDRLCRRP